MLSPFLQEKVNYKKINVTNSCVSTCIVDSKLLNMKDFVFIAFVLFTRHVTAFFGLVGIIFEIHMQIL